MTTATTGTSAVGPGRGGRMSRPRKREAVLRLLRGEDLETVSRSLGVTAAALTAWRDAFLAAGEAALATRPADGETPASERLKARLGEMLLRQELLEGEIAALEAGRPLARRRSRRWAGRPHHRSAGRTGSPWSVASGASPARPSTAIASRPAAAGAGRADAGRRAPGGGPGGAGGQPVPRRGPPQGVGEIAPRRRPHLPAPGAAADARARPARPLAHRRAARPPQPRRHDHPRDHRHDVV